jgi:formylglycine-generating enzyme required for sulfatase activity
MSDSNTVDELYTLLTEHYQAQYDHAARTDQLNAAHADGLKKVEAQRKDNITSSQEKRAREEQATEKRRLDRIAAANGALTTIREAAEKTRWVEGRFGKPSMSWKRKLDEQPALALESRANRARTLPDQMEQVHKQINVLRERRQRRIAIGVMAIVGIVIGTFGFTFAAIDGQNKANATATQASINTAVAIANSNATATQASLSTATAITISNATATQVSLNTATAQSLFALVKSGKNVVQDFDGVPMVMVPPGCFMMGSENGESDEKPVTQICFDQSFWIDKYEVTQAQFKQFAGQAVQKPYFIGDNHPVEQITWFEARDFCAKRGARLPTEAEWEYAARGPDNLVYPWGNSFDGNKVVYGHNSGNQTANVGSKPGGASWVGALDMSGNVWEWTSSLYKPYPYKADDGRESNSGTNGSRVLRGGSWRFLENFLRAASRDRSGPTGEVSYDGFRCARS